MQWVYRLGLGGAPVPHGSAPVGALHRERSRWYIWGPIFEKS